MKVILLVLAVLFSAYGGWSYRDSGAKAEVAQLNHNFEIERVARIEAAAKSLAYQKQEGDKAIAALAEKNRSATIAAIQLQKEIYRVKDKADSAGVPRVPFSVGWVRLYDGALYTASGNSDTSGFFADTARIANLPDEQPAGIDQWGAILTHVENARKWAGCVNQLNALIDFYESGRDVNIPASDK